MRRVLLLAGLLLGSSAAGCLDPATNGWALAATQLDAVHPTHGPAIRVAILDSGIDLDHPSLAHLKDGDRGDGEVVQYTDFLASAQHPRDRGGHGTFVAGVLAAAPPAGFSAMTSSGSSVRGLAPGLELVVGRVCDGGHCDLATVVYGLEWALAQGVDIVSLSLGYGSEDVAQHAALAERMRRLLQEAEQKGVLVVAAAGNTEGGVLFPATVPTVLAVGAMGRDGQVRATSARGYGSLKPDLVAPGEGIVGPAEGGGLATVDGTSVAVPFVVASAVRLMQGVANPGDADGVALLRQALRDSARPLAGQRLPHDPWAGHGLVQAASASSTYATLVAAHQTSACGGRTGHSCTGNGRATTPSPMATGPVEAAWSSTTSSSSAAGPPAAPPPSTRPAAT